MKKILLVGAGNMGSAIGKALLSTNFIQPENFFIADSSKEKLTFFQEKKCHTTSEAEKFLPESNIVILATKPQVLRNILTKWAEKKIFSEKTILLSIAAGISVAELQKFSGQQKVVRVMPNTPLLVEKGISGYFFSSEISEQEREKISQMINSFGLAIECETEEKINAITALSGSGPAYFFLLLEAMAQQAEYFGFSPEESEKISLHTLLGAGFLAEESIKNTGENFSILRKNVTSKGGTTESALNFFEKNNFTKIFQEGIISAKNRAEEL